MFEIKADPKLPYHYIIGVAVNPPVAKDVGKLYLKYFLEFQHEDIEKVRTNVNNVTLHHFSTAHELDDEFFENLVDRATTSEHDKKLLDKSRI